MLENLFANHAEYLIPIIALIGGTVIAVVAILMHQWRAGRQAEMDSALKQDMLQRGMSVDEIERVIVASASAEARTRQEPISDNEYYLVEKLVEEGKTVEEIERIIKAFKGPGAVVSIKTPTPSEAPPLKPERA
jgi:hypothetical protein